MRNLIKTLIAILVLPFIGILIFAHKNMSSGLTFMGTTIYGKQAAEGTVVFWGTLYSFIGVPMIIFFSVALWVTRKK